MSFDLVPVKRPTTGEVFIPPQAETKVTVDRGTPHLRRTDFFCAKCQRPPEQMAHYSAATHCEPRTRMTPEKQKACRDQGLPIFDCGRGYLHGTILCHGEQLEFMATFDQAWMAIDSGKPIVIYDNIVVLENPAKSSALGADHRASLPPVSPA